MQKMQKRIPTIFRPNPQNAKGGTNAMKLGLAYFGGYDQQKVDLEKEMGLR